MDTTREKKGRVHPGFLVAGGVALLGAAAYRLKKEDEDDEVVIDVSSVLAWLSGEPGAEAGVTYPAPPESRGMRRMAKKGKSPTRPIPPSAVAIRNQGIVAKWKSKHRIPDHLVDEFEQRMVQGLTVGDKVASSSNALIYKVRGPRIRENEGFSKPDLRTYITMRDARQPSFVIGYLPKSGSKKGGEKETSPVLVKRLQDQADLIWKAFDNVYKAAHQRAAKARQATFQLRFGNNTLTLPV